MEPGDKARENRLRRAAARQGLRVSKVRRMDPRAVDYGRYHITDAQTGACRFEARDLARAEAYLASGEFDDVRMAAYRAELACINAYLHAASGSGIEESQSTVVDPIVRGLLDQHGVDAVVMLVDALCGGWAAVIQRSDAAAYGWVDHVTHRHADLRQPT